MTNPVDPFAISRFNTQALYAVSIRATSNCNNGMDGFHPTTDECMTKGVRRLLIRFQAAIGARVLLQTKGGR